MKHQFGHLLIILGIFVMALMPISYANAEESDNKDFDFETWHDEAMQAYENFSSLFYSIQDDPTWEIVNDLMKCQEVAKLDCQNKPIFIIQ